MRIRVSVLLSLLVLGAPALAAAQVSPFGPSPATQSPTTASEPTATTPKADDGSGLSASQTTIILSVAAVLVLGIAWAIFRDAHTRVPPAEIAHEGESKLRDQTERTRRKQQARARAKRARAARRRNRPR